MAGGGPNTLAFVLVTTGESGTPRGLALAIAGLMVAATVALAVHRTRPATTLTSLNSRPASSTAQAPGIAVFESTTVATASPTTVVALPAPTAPKPIPTSPAVTLPPNRAS